MISMISMYLLKISAGIFKSSLALAGRGFHPTARHVVNEAGFEAGKHRAAGQEKGGGTPIAGWFIVVYSGKMLLKWMIKRYPELFRNPPSHPRIS